MSEKPLVSVLTPTYERAELLTGAIGNVRVQTYRPLEHVVVSDGQDAALRAILAPMASPPDGYPPPDVPLVFAELGRNWSSFLPDAYAWAPVTVATLLARGEYHAWLADDERMDPDHLETLVDALEAAGADFAYSKTRMWSPVGQGTSWLIGKEPPERGQITHCVYRADLLKRGLYHYGDSRASDWRTIERWLAAGATYAFVDRETFTHRADR